MSIKLIENINIKLSFYIILVLYKNLLINNDRKIKKDKILKTIDRYIDELQYVYNNRFDLDEAIFINYIDNTHELSKYNNLFNINNKFIELNDNINIDDLEEELNSYFESYDTYNTVLSIIDMDVDLKKELGFTKIKELFSRYKSTEDKIEKYYINGISNNKLKELLKQREFFYRKIISNDEDYLWICEEEGTSIDDKDPYEDNYPFDSKYDEIYNDDNELEYDDEVYTEEEIENMFMVDEILHDPYMYAIFSNYPLSSSRIEEDINNIIIHNEEENNTSTPRSIVDKYFFMTYINELDELVKIYNKDELNITKNRLLYLLDDYKTNLLDKNEYNKEYNRIKILLSRQNIYDNDIIDRNNIEWWKDLVMASIDELFNNDDEILKLKKFALIKTYYSITKDMDIIMKLKGYSNNINYIKYKSLLNSKIYEKKK